MGATVMAACRRETSFEKMRLIGADFCIIDDGHISEQSLPVKPNKILELVGPKTLRDSLLTVSHPGYVCSTGVLGNVYTVRDFAPIKYIPNGTFLTGFFSNFPTQQVIDDLFALIRKAHIRPLYSRVFTLDEIVEAHTLLEKGGAGGKIILSLHS